ncbi:MAG: undecaprenyl-diphosphatase [Chloroflexota bacterium]|jgi:undecaprenyl-diphosphatase|nr:undecaprenyl-diphosphatase [Chloroflexota bacterium]
MASAARRPTLSGRISASKRSAPQSDLRFHEALLLGAVQGVTEFLPVSSTGHLILARLLLRRPPDPDVDLLIDVALHLGTLGALMTTCAHDWRRAAMALLHLALGRRPDPADARIAAVLCLATLPPILVGGRWPRVVQGSGRSPQRVGTAMAVVGLILGLVDRWAPSHRAAPGPMLGIALGLAQAAALVPGVSRSGATILACRLLGLERTTAVRTSFLVAGPVTVAAVAKELWEARQVRLGRRLLAPLAAGILTSCIAGMLTNRWLLRYAVHHELWSFALYRLLMGTALVGRAPLGSRAELGS